MNSISSAWSRTHHNIILKPVCGYCNHTLDQHNLPMWERPGEYGFECYVTDDLGNLVERNSRNGNLDPIVGMDYYVVADSTSPTAQVFDRYALPYFDHSGNPSDPRISEDYNRDLEYDYESYDSIWEPVDRWSDKDPEVKTHAVAWWTNGTAPKAYAEDAPQRTCDRETNWSIEPDLRNAYVEGNDAFLSLQVLDPELTRKYHARLLNWFLTKEGKVRVGSMEFGVNANGERYVQCVRACCKDSQGNWYKPGALIDNFSSSRETMETLVLSIIQHGNNCAASFIRSRADWYPIHSEGCDLNHSASEGCNSKANRIRFDGDVAFVMDHQQYCRDSRCKCSEWLASEVPALSATA